MHFNYIYAVRFAFNKYWITFSNCSDETLVNTIDYNAIQSKPYKCHSCHSAREQINKRNVMKTYI